jgi:NTE family protein
VLGGGGERAIAWQIGVLAGLADAGLDGRSAGTILGTSTGSVAAARLAAGLDPRADAERIATTPPTSIPSQLRRAVSDAIPKLSRIVWAEGPDGDPTRRRRRAGEFALHWRGLLSAQAHIDRQSAVLPEVGWPATLRLVVIDANTGERVVLDSSTGALLPEGVAAARALPGLVEPVALAGRRLIDGALGSATNADLVSDDAGVALVIVATPLRAEPRTLEAFWNEALATEFATLASRRIKFAVVHASASAVEAMGDDLMSAAGAPAAVSAGRTQGSAVAEALLAGLGSVAVRRAAASAGAPSAGDGDRFPADER